MAWLAPAARRAAATTARRAPPLLLDSTASSAARRATLQPAPPVRHAAASDPHLLAAKAKQPLALLDATATDTHLLGGKAKKPLALMDAAATNLLAGKAKQPRALLDATATDTHLLGRGPLLAATAKPPPALLDATASSSVVKAIADVRQPPIAKTGGFLFDLYGPRRASRGILFSAMNSARVRTLAQRGMSSEASLTPEVKAELQRMEEASVARHLEAAEAFGAFRASTRKAYAMHEVNKANNTVAHARVGWRVVWGTLALGTIGLYYTLHIKSLWIVQFKLRVLFLLTDMIYELQEELEQSLKEIVGVELAPQSGMGADKPGALRDILNDSQLMAELSDPEVLRALQDVMRNPANIAKYQSNPKVGPVIAKVMAKLGGDSCDQ